MPQLLIPSDTVLSVNGQVDNVVLTTSEIDEGSNLYYTDLRASDASPVQSVAGKTGDVSLNKNDVGLGNVSNNLQLIASNNLSDLTDVATARNNLELGDIVILNADHFDLAGSADDVQNLLESHESQTNAHGSTSSNSSNSIVRRDGSGNFSAGTITANLSGNATSITGNIIESQVTGLEDDLNAKANLSSADFIGDIQANNLSGTNTGDVTIGTANGLSISNQQLSLAVFQPSGIGHSAGAVPDPGASSNSIKFLREDGNWIEAIVPGSNNNITSLSGLTTPLSVAQGGSGINSLTGLIVGNGTSAFSTTAKPSGTVVGTSDSQTLTNKTIDAGNNTLIGIASSGTNTDITALNGVSNIRIASGSAPGSPITGDIWNDSTQKCFMGYVDGIKQSLIGCIFTATDDAVIVNSVTETTIIPVGVGTTTLPSNFFVVGKTLRIKASGTISTAIVAGTLNIKLKLGSTIIGQTTAATLTNSLASQFWNIDTLVTCRSVGTSGTVIASGKMELNIGLGLLSMLGLPPTSVTTINTTGSLALNLTATFGSLSNSFNVSQFIVEVLN